MSDSTVILMGTVGLFWVVVGVLAMLHAAMGIAEHRADEAIRRRSVRYYGYEHAHEDTVQAHAQAHAQEARDE